MKILVTLSGECFDAEYIDAGHDGRDGTLFYFKLLDLSKDRGLRGASLFLSGTDKVFIDNYDARIETVRLNVLRRAFDSGTLSFETPFIAGQGKELPLRATDFHAQKKASDATIRRFIKFGAYYLGFKHAPSGNLFVDFDCAEDLEYLGAKSEDIGRNVRLLTEEGYLRSSAATLANPSRVSPTAKLIREFEDADDVDAPPREHPDSLVEDVPMSKTADVIRGIKQLRKELEEIRAGLRLPGMVRDEGLLDEKLKKWTNRAYEELKAWGFNAEAEEGFGRNSITHMYEGVGTRAKSRDDKLHALLDDISSHPEHYDARLGFSQQEVGSSGKSGSPMPAKSAVLVLISHSSKDERLAKAVIELLQTGLGLLANQIRCTSVDGHRLPVGVNTDAQLRREIADVGVLIGLLTLNSIASSYVLFELGARWGLELPMFPLLAGIAPDQMPGPQRVFNALSCSNESQLIQFVEDTGRALKITPQSSSSYLDKARIVKQLSDNLIGQKSQTTPNPPEMVYEESVYWKMKNGTREGPYCPNCYDDKGKVIHLNPGASRGTYGCRLCQDTFWTREASRT